MSLAIIHEGRKVRIPKHIEVRGREAIHEFLEEQSEFNARFRVEEDDEAQNEQQEED